VKPLVKILSAVVSLVAGMAASKLVERTWTSVTGDAAPTKKNKDARENQSVARLVTFAAVSAGTAALINAATQRGAQRLVQRSASHPEEV